ncbi:MAG TPA: hypothetical protein VN673_19025 [Clostridia bacterium]|nr:hypothetical protein [Clostridia bacterium]
MKTREQDGRRLVRAGVASSLGTAVVIFQLVAGLPRVWAQVVADGTTNTLNNVTNSITGDVTVGANGVFTLLVVTNNALLTNTVHGFIGRSATAHSNTVLVAGAGARWHLGHTFFVGATGSFNRLILRDGGTARGARAYVGHWLVSRGNQALVTGPGSHWSLLTELYIGGINGGNQLVISNGGSVYNGLSGYVGVEGGTNLAVVTGSGSGWTNLGDLFVGVSSAANRMVVSDGGRVRNHYGFIGVNLGSSNNSALVTDPGSLWTNGTDFHVGWSGARNQLVISNGGTLYSASRAYVGYNFSSASNSVTVTGPGSRWLVASNLYVGSNGPASRMLLSAGALVVNREGAIGQSSSSNEVVVTGPGTLWSNRSDLIVGLNGPGNRLVISNGATVKTGGVGEIGKSSGAFNTVWVTGPGSFWTNADVLLIGRSGVGNQLVISNGGTVSTLSYSYFGVSSGASSNGAVVTGLGSVWNNGGLSFDSSTGNRLIITNGGVVRSGYSYVGLGDRSTNNLLVITGPGSTMDNFGDLTFGHVLGHNRMLVEDGGLLRARNVYVGYSSSSTNNRVEINGGTLRLTNVFEGMFDVRGGTNVLNGGLVEINWLMLTNTQGEFEFRSGTLSTAGTSNANGRVFTVGNGSPATLLLRGGLHAFAQGLVIAPNASLLGTGAITGTLTVQPGGALAPGLPLGRLTLSNSPALQGATLMDLARTGATRTNDQIQVTAPLAYGGQLLVTNSGPDPLALGDRFQLFLAPAYSGSFNFIELPPLPYYLAWTNKLLLDGSIEVIQAALPQIAAVVRLGTNLVFSGTGGTANTDYAVLTSTNVALPLSIWTSIATNQFGPTGAFAFTNPIAPLVPRRFYVLRIHLNLDPD